MKLLTKEIKQDIEGAKRAQIKSLIRVLKRQDITRLSAVCFDAWENVLFVKFTYILIGIEHDGYAHN